jgi:hypothetical protein
MTNDPDGIKPAALEMIKRFGDAAAYVAREMAEIANERHGDILSAETWRDIADAIERLSVKTSTS